MARPHPAVAACRSAVKRALAALPEPVSEVWVACSGGADSLALASAVSFLAPRMGWRTGLVTVDHGLQVESAQVARQVTRQGRALGFHQVVLKQVKVAAASNLEAHARAARYQALWECLARHAHPDAVLLTAHTQDDQAESVLLGLLRGSGGTALAGIAPIRGRLVRPLLEISRAQTLAAAQAKNLQVWHDPTNADPRYAKRNQIRLEVLPYLDRELGPGVIANLARSAALLRTDMSELDRQAQQEWDTLQHTAVSATEHRFSIAVAPLQQLPSAIRTRVLKLFLTTAGAVPVTAEAVWAVDALVHSFRGQGPKYLPRGFQCARQSGRLIVTKSVPPRI